MLSAVIDFIHHLQSTAIVLHRRDTYFGFKSAAKDGQLGISTIQSYLLDRLRGIAEHASSCINSHIRNIGIRRIAGCFFEYSFDGVALCIFGPNQVPGYTIPESHTGTQPDDTPGSSPEKQGTHRNKRLYVVYTETTVNP